MTPLVQPRPDSVKPKPTRPARAKRPAPINDATMEALLHLTRFAARRRPDPKQLLVQVITSCRPEARRQR